MFKVFKLESFFEIESYSPQNVVPKWVIVVQVSPNHIAVIMMPMKYPVVISVEWGVILVKCVVHL